MHYPHALAHFHNKSFELDLKLPHCKRQIIDMEVEDLGLGQRISCFVVKWRKVCRDDCEEKENVEE